jgi:hypothetical protein
MAGAVDLLVITTLTLWTVCALANQLEPVRVRFRRWDCCSIIPSWRLFAPNRVGDYHLMYRDVYEVVGTGPWREIRVKRQTGWRRAVWDSRKRERKMLFDACAYVAAIASRGNSQTLRLTLPYLLLLHGVEKLGSHPMLARGTQFAIIKTHGTLTPDAPAIVFVSEIHRLDGASPTRIVS